MGGVTNEAAHLFFFLLRRHQGVLQLGEHDVQRRSELPHFGAHGPLRDPSVEVTGGDVPRCMLDFFEGPERAAHGPHGDQAEDAQHDKPDEYLHNGESPQEGVFPLQALRHNGLFLALGETEDAPTHMVTVANGGDGGGALVETHGADIGSIRAVVDFQDCAVGEAFEHVEVAGRALLGCPRPLEFAAVQPAFRRLLQLTVHI